MNLKSALPHFLEAFEVDCCLLFQYLVDNSYKVADSWGFSFDDRLYIAPLIWWEILFIHKKNKS